MFSFSCSVFSSVYLIFFFFVTFLIFFFFFMFFFIFFFFFFSSRRRHTRLTCDWSSDVCSSDLNDRVKQMRELLRRDTLHGHLAGDEPLIDHFDRDAHGRGGRTLSGSRL